MIESKEIPLSQKTLRSPHKDNVLEIMGRKNFLGQFPSEQQARNKIANELKKLKKNPLFKVERKKHLETEKARRELEEVSVIDPLTNLYLRRFLDGNPNTSPPKKGILEREIERIFKGNKKLTVAMLDIDHFKEVNDQYGHQVGDEVLRKVAETVLKNIRFNLGDFAIRFGGDEFLIITPNSLDVAQKMIEKIRSEIERISFNNDNKYPKGVTISCGLTNLVEDVNDGNYKEIAEAMTNRADNALYESKREDGKNHTTVALHNKKGTTEFIRVFHENKV
ncbi:MAG: GGDEF domain-containing protein [Candidatus Curtissbacteria bacterium]|nr:GGDEF domain-containing protein [Candidatus Roizmanbacteria bacterium]MCR4325051.1 GGDEF domain-containing protein [Candidatus Curtissbacteria bacterium]